MENVRKQGEEEKPEGWPGQEDQFQKGSGAEGMCRTVEEHSTWLSQDWREEGGGTENPRTSSTLDHNRRAVLHRPAFTTVVHLMVCYTENRQTKSTPGVL